MPSRDTDAYLCGESLFSTMCRLLGVLASPNTPAEPWLVGSERSLLAQSNASADSAQKDGWGIAWYDERRKVRLEKGVGGAYVVGERERFVRTAQQAHGPVVIGHLRHASNPMNLPHERLIALENSQPFVHGSAVFAHNGSIPFPRETRPMLGPFESKVQGVNDSEIFFWLFLRHVELTGNPLTAYVNTTNDIRSVWKAQKRLSTEPFSALNILFSRGPNELWAFCRWTGDHGGSLLDPERPYFEMVYAADSQHLVVGSEPFDSRVGAWRPIPNGTYLSAQAEQGLIGVGTGPIPAPTPG